MFSKKCNHAVTGLACNVTVICHEVDHFKDYSIVEFDIQRKGSYKQSWKWYLNDDDHVENSHEYEIGKKYQLTIAPFDADSHTDTSE